MSALTVPEHPLTADRLTRLQDRATGQGELVRVIESLEMVLAVEAGKRLQKMLVTE